jgi:hypothetical protein
VKKKWFCILQKRDSINTQQKELKSHDHRFLLNKLSRTHSLSILGSSSPCLRPLLSGNHNQASILSQTSTFIITFPLAKMRVRPDFKFYFKLHVHFIINIMWKSHRKYSWTRIALRNMSDAMTKWMRILTAAWTRPRFTCIVTNTRSRAKHTSTPSLRKNISLWTKWKSQMCMLRKKYKNMEMDGTGKKNTK